MNYLDLLPNDIIKITIEKYKIYILLNGEKNEKKIEKFIENKNEMQIEKDIFLKNM